MGDRAVITTKKNYENNGIGIYLHWNGDRTSVDSFLEYCKMKGYRSPEDDSYGWARLCQIIGNFFEGTLSIGIDTVDRLDCDNLDNGTYLIEDWKVVGRKFNYFEDYINKEEKEKLMKVIDNRQPEKERIFTNCLNSYKRY